MFCRICGIEIPDDSRFCTACGTVVVRPADPEERSAKEDRTSERIDELPGSPAKEDVARLVKDRGLGGAAKDLDLLPGELMDILGKHDIYYLNPLPSETDPDQNEDAHGQDANKEE